MAKITRFNGDLKGFATQYQGSERTVFGDTAQSDSLDDNINADWLRGWGIVGVNENPTKQDFNALGFTVSQLIAYLHQMGVAEYNASQEYHTGSITQKGGNFFVSQTDNNTGNDPETDDGTNWQDIRQEATVDSVATLRASSFPANLERLYLSGYYGVGTPGGGEVYADRSDTTSLDNGGTVFRDADDVRWKRPDKAHISVTDFGAKGSGNNADATINTTAFNAANTYTAGNGKTLIIPSGDYRHDDTITLSGNKTVLGGGFLDTILRITTSSNPGVANNCQGYVDGFEVNGDQVASGANGMEVDVSGRIHIGMIQCSNYNNGCVYKRANSSVIDHLICRDNANYGFWIDASTVDTNGIRFFVDARANGSDGVRIGEPNLGDANEQPRQLSGVVSSQSNGGYGLSVHSRSSHYILYAESNTSGSALFQGAGAFGNWMFNQNVGTINEASDSSGSPANNIVHGILGTTAEVGYDNLISEKFTLPSYDFTGRMDFFHDSDDNYRMEFSGSAASFQGVTVENVGTGDVFWNVEGPIQSNGDMKPLTDDTYTCGDNDQRWDVVFATTGTINTSDRNEKQQIHPVDDALLDAWADVEWVNYKWNKAVEEKGDAARTHTGLIAQQVKEALEAHGLDAMSYGLVCYDEWEDDDGNIQSRYGVRYSECQAVEAAYIRRKLG